MNNESNISELTLKRIEMSYAWSVIFGRTDDMWLDLFSIEKYTSSPEEIENIEIDIMNGWLEIYKKNNELTYYKLTEKCKNYLRIMLLL